MKIFSREGASVSLLAVSMFASLVFAEATHDDLIVLAVGGLKHERGQVIANLFREGDDIFRKPFARVKAKIIQGKATLIFQQVPFGNYAVTVFQDENGNDALDHNLIRFPAEPLGFSNGFKLSLFSGMPSFKKLRFAFDTDTKPIEIVVK